MLPLIRVLLPSILRVFRSRRNLLLENLVLRQQLAVLKRKRPRPRIAALDKVFWVFARRFWPGWKQALIVVTPDTVVRWHRAGFALYWRAISRTRRVFGRKQISKEVRELIFRMVHENLTWGGLRIHGELLMLGFDLSERTISRWMKRAPRDPEPAQRWLASFEIIGKLSLRWTSSPFRRSPSVCSTAFSSSTMIGGAFCINQPPSFSGVIPIF